MTDILADVKPKTITLADGKEYNLPPINLTTLANVEKTLGFGLGKLQSKLDDETATTMRALIFALLKETHPELKIADVGSLITLKEIGAISKTITEIVAIST